MVSIPLAADCIEQQAARDTETMRSALSLRWVAVGIFIISTTLNFLDRALLAVLAPLIMSEMHLDLTGFGFLVSAFSIAYAASSLGTGWFLDRAGVNRGISAAVAWWSAAAASMGLVRGVTGLAVCRAALGIGESAGVPAVGKLNGVYLKPEERALGAALNQVGISLGLALAPLSIGLAAAYTWRLPFVAAGLLGFLWIPIWWLTSCRIRPQFGDVRGEQRGPVPDLGWRNSGSVSILRAEELGSVPISGHSSVLNLTPTQKKQPPRLKLLLDPSLIALMIANILWMSGYSLWSNWTTLYLIQVHGLTLNQTASYVWIPPLISNFGGFFGGWLSQRWMRRSLQPVAARRRAVQWSSAGCLLTLLLPLMPDARWATLVISVSFFFLLAGSVNIYAIPIDLFGAARSGVAISALVFSFGLMQTIISPVFGYLAEHKLYTAVIWIVTIPPILSALVLKTVREAETV
jgi:MFS family permease